MTRSRLCFAVGVPEMRFHAQRIASLRTQRIASLRTQRHRGFPAKLPARTAPDQAARIRTGRLARERSVLL